MSRTYLLQGSVEGVSNDLLWSFFCKWCGHSQIYKIETDMDLESFFVCEMGCSSGVHSADTIRSLKSQLQKVGGKNIWIACWSLHSDDVDCELRTGEED